MSFQLYADALKSAPQADRIRPPRERLGVSSWHRSVLVVFGIPGVRTVRRRNAPGIRTSGAVDVNFPARSALRANQKTTSTGAVAVSPVKARHSLTRSPGEPSKVSGPSEASAMRFAGQPATGTSNGARARTRAGCRYPRVVRSRPGAAW